jgi:hypothetical protein
LADFFSRQGLSNVNFATDYLLILTFAKNCKFLAMATGGCKKEWDKSELQGGTRKGAHSCARVCPLIIQINRYCPTNWKDGTWRKNQGVT